MEGPALIHTYVSVFPIVLCYVKGRIKFLVIHGDCSAGRMVEVKAVSFLLLLRVVSINLLKVCFMSLITLLYIPSQKQSGSESSDESKR